MSIFPLEIVAIKKDIYTARVYGFWLDFHLKKMISKWYITGTISLLGILPLFLWKSFPIQKKFNESTMNVYLPIEGDKGDEVLEFSEGMILREVRRKKQTAFYLNDFLEQREEVLESIQQTAMEIKFGYDTSRVVKVVLGNRCTFNDFVSVLNICLIDKHKRWAWVQDSIFIFAPDPLR